MKKITIIGAGKLGSSIANGLIDSKIFTYSDLILTRRKQQFLEPLNRQGFNTTTSNSEAVKQSEVVILAVEPRHAQGVMEEIKDLLNPQKHIFISVIAGLTLAKIESILGKNQNIIRAMPNTAVAVRESITCFSANTKDTAVIEEVKKIFSSVGEVIQINEENMLGATALGGCGIAFFMRAIRAASQGGIEIGFSSETAIAIAAQAAKGAATLIINNGKHPEYEIDKVTTPRGCTIAGLNQMEHEGFSSAMIKGILTSAEKAATLCRENS